LSGVSYFSKGQAVYVTVTANDGTTSTALSSSSVTVSNTEPTAPVVEITPSDPVEGDDLTCTVTTPATDADGDAITYSFAWDVDGVDYSSATDSATDSVVDGADVGAEETWTCEVVASDGTGTSGVGTDSATMQSCSALDFDGVNDYLSVPASSSMVFSGSRSIEMWVKWDGSTSRQYQWLAGQGWGGGSVIAYRLQLQGSADSVCGGGPGRLIMAWGEGGSTDYCMVSSSPLTSGAWQHVAAVYDGAAWTLYIDGASVGNHAASSVPSGSGYPASFGGYVGYPNDYPFGGEIGAVRLSASGRYSGSFTPANSWVADSATRLLLGMDEGSGATAFDASTNGNNGSIVGPAWIGDCPL
jgi:hypothetical protein